MNWFTKAFVSTLSIESKAKKCSQMDCCEHVEADNSLLSVISRENDSFGSEAYGMCDACNEWSMEEEGKEEVVCHDCKETKEKKDTYEWKWYDFYAPQGDEPLCICDACRKLPKHIARVKKDRQERDEELYGNQDCDSDQDDYYSYYLTGEEKQELGNNSTVLELQEADVEFYTFRMKELVSKFEKDFIPKENSLPEYVELYNLVLEWLSQQVHPYWKLGEFEAVFSRFPKAWLADMAPLITGKTKPF